MQQASVEKFSNLIGAIYDCVIAPERWAAVLGGICAEFGFATGALSVASLTNMEAGVNAVSGSNLAQMAQNGIAYGTDIIELWGGAERIQQYPLGEPIVQSQAVRQDVILGNRYYLEWALPKGLFDAVAVGLVKLVLLHHVRRDGGGSVRVDLHVLRLVLGEGLMKEAC